LLQQVNYFGVDIINGQILHVTSRVLPAFRMRISLPDGLDRPPLDGVLKLL
jgi:hypothetical protein